MSDYSTSDDEDDKYDRTDFIQNDDTGTEEDAYHIRKGFALFDESYMITRTDLYAFAEEFMTGIENQTFLWPVPMLRIINFFTEKSVAFAEGIEPINYQQLFNEVNLVMVMLLLDVPVQLDIEIGDKIIDLNGERKINYKQQPFHEPLIMLNILEQHRVITRDMIRKDVCEVLNKNGSSRD